MVKRLLSQGIRGTLPNWKSLEMWTSLLSGTASEFDPNTSLPSSSFLGTKLPLRSITEMATPTQKFSHKNLTPILFPNPKSRSSLPQGAFLWKHKRHTQEHTKSSTENKPPFSKHLENTLISESVHLLVSWFHHPCPVPGQKSFQRDVSLKPKS